MYMKFYFLHALLMLFNFPYDEEQAAIDMLYMYILRRIRFPEAHIPQAFYSAAAEKIKPVKYIISYPIFKMSLQSKVS